MNPVILTGSLLVADGAVGHLDDERALQNWTGELLRVDELHFLFGDGSAVDGLVSDPAPFEIALRVGSEPITNGFVPLYGMTWPKDRNHERLFKARRLSFSKPVYLAPGERIHVTAKHTTASTTYRLEVLAWTRPAPPDRVAGQHYLPWITGHKFTALAENAGVFTPQVVGRDVFNNSFNVPIHVERLIGQVHYNGDEYEGGLAGVVNTATLTYLFRDLRVRIDDHLGNKIVRERTPFGVVFEQIRKSWIVNTILPPKGYFRVSLEGNLAGAADTGSHYLLQPYVGMLAYRPAAR